MGREIRRVPEHWLHPRNSNGEYIPLLDGWSETLGFQWDRARQLWMQGKHSDQLFGGLAYQNLEKAIWYEEWHGPRPDPTQYMHPQGKRTHFQYYETTTEGTPISPVFPSLEELAQWLHDRYDRRLSKDEWLDLCQATLREYDD